MTDTNHAPALPMTPPPGSRLSRGWKIAIGLVVAAVAIGLGGYAIRLPYYTLAPGPAEDVGKLIHVSGRTYPSQGAFLLTTVTVSSQRVNVWDAVVALFDTDLRLVGRGAIVAPGLTDQEQELLNRHDMELSKYTATVVALRAAGLSVPPVAGARVVDVAPGTPAAAVLKQGDVIVAVDGARVNGLERTIELLRKREVGDQVTLQVLRASSPLRFTMKTVAGTSEPGAPMIGVALAEAFRLPVEVSIDSMGIVGPSGGLVFALAIADAITTDDLTSGRRIAATGTIALDGSIGPIGGVAEKVAAAEFAKADVFLVPADEEAEARRAARRIQVLGVRTIADAIGVLSAMAPAAAA